MNSGKQCITKQSVIRSRDNNEWVYRLFIIGLVLIGLIGFSCQQGKTSQKTNNETMTDQTSVPATHPESVTLPDVPSIKVYTEIPTFDQIQHDITSLDEWKEEEPPKVYTPATLSDLINGSAEDYLAFGFDSLLYYPRLRYHQTRFSVYIYKMEKQFSAFGIYSAEKPYRYEQAPIEQDGYWQDDELVFWEGSFYLKTRVLNEEGTAFDRSVVEQFMNGIKRFIPDETTALEQIRAIFPKVHQETTSFQYQPSGFEGLEFIQHVFRCEHVIDGKRLKTFVAFYKSPPQANKVIGAFRAFISNDCGGNNYSDQRTKKIYYADCSYFEGKQYLLVNDGKVFGLFGDIEVDEAYDWLEKMMERAVNLNYKDLEN